MAQAQPVVSGLGSNAQGLQALAAAEATSMQAAHAQQWPLGTHIPNLGVALLRIGKGNLRDVLQAAEAAAGM